MKRKPYIVAFLLGSTLTLAAQEVVPVTSGAEARTGKEGMPAAQEAPSAGPQSILSLQECRDLALKHNKQMAAAVQQTASAHYTALSYKGNFFPNFTANGLGLYSTADGRFGIPGGNLPVFTPNAQGIPLPNGSFAYFPGVNLDYKIGWVYTGGIQVEQPLFMGGKILAAYRMAKLGRQVAQLNETLTATEVIEQTDQAYALAVKAREMQEVAQAYHAVLAELKKNVDSAYKHGLKPQNDVLKVQVRLNESELAIRKAENAVRLASMNLCHLIGRPLTETVEVSREFPVPPLDGQEVQTLDVSARPEYALLDKQVAVAQQQVRLNRSELLPKIGVRGSYDYIHGLEVNQENLLNGSGFTVMLNVSVPLFHFGERYNKVRAAKAKLIQTRLEQQNLNEQMLLQLTQAANNLDEAQLEAELADRSLQQADENRRVSRKQYEVGLEPLSDHLEAQALWQQAYETQVDAHFQLYLSYVAYLKAAGQLYRPETVQK